MRRTKKAVLTGWLALAALALGLDGANPHEGDIPYSLELSGFTIDGLPGLHSAIYAGDERQLVILGGRTNGMHGFPSIRNTSSAPSFPADARNHNIYVVDLENRKLLGSASADGLPQKIANQLTSSNAQFVLTKGVLFVVGGYGLYNKENAANPGLTPIYTIPTAMAIDFKALVAAVRSGRPLDQSFADANIGTLDDPNFQITGGALKQMNSLLALVFGHSMNGLYTQGGGTMTQSYSSSVRVWAMNARHVNGRIKLSATLAKVVPDRPYGGDPSQDPYHRRDLSVEGAIDASGKERFVAYGGVFVAGRFDGFLHPVDIDGPLAAPYFLRLTEDKNTTQLLSQYECAVIPLYSFRGRAMYSTFFGGISEFYWKDGALHHDPPNLNIDPPVDGLPFINSISTLKNDYTKDLPVSAQYLHVESSFPPGAAGQQPRCGGKPAVYLGAETRFVRVGAVPHYRNEVLMLDKIENKRVIGYLIGGMTADAMYAPPNSCASDMIYRVTLDPSQSTVTKRLVAPEQ